MEATLAGMPCLSRRKSIRRYCCLCPPPWWRTAICPTLFRPPFLRKGSSSDFSGFCLVTSSRMSMLAKRREGVVGLYVFTAISVFLMRREPPPVYLRLLAVLDHLFAGLELHKRLLPVAAEAHRAA